LLQFAPVAIASIDLDGRVLDANRMLLATSGYTLQEIRGVPFMAFLDPDENRVAGVAFESLVSGARDSYQIERRYRTRSGETRDVDVSVSLVRDGAGTPQMCLAVLQDVTEHKQTEAALSQSEARYRALVEQAPLSIQILSPDGRTLQVNAAWERLWGATLEQLGDYNLLTDPQLIERGLMPYIRRGFEGHAARVPASLYDPDQTLPRVSRHEDPKRWVRAVIYPLKDGRGKVWEVVLIHEDITEQVRADEQRREATELLQLVVQQSGEAIIVADARGVLRIFNPEAERLYGLPGAPTPAEDWPTRYRLLRLDGTPLPYDETALYRAVTGEVVREARWLVHRPDGSVRTLVGSSTPLRRPDGSLAGAVLIAHDDTDRLAAEQEREALLVQAQAAHRDVETASRMKDEFLATLSHELRTPLNAILGWTRILRTQGYDAETQRALDVIERNAAAQARLIDDLLDVSRIITGKILLQTGTVDIARVVASALETIKPAADAKAIRLESSVAAGLPTINGDAQRLQQVFWNLLSNAVKFSEAGGVVSLAIDRDERHIVAVVSDMGAGIVPSILPFVFDRFMQGDSSSTRAHSGLGLGLAIVRHLVELHGGTVSAESAGEGRGSTFRVSLPLIA